ncbi:WD40 repeat-like-containing domain protein [Metarhizium rileyi]|uniref:WD40 repeat-like-containing domain protein n=1 Tax=Metarhizium rileyi (strain RCEF 4871) TaxID=1649241 RepID=A0A162JM52_METRR|nr:WD40 repeat-like-containing domain protein [Metarhizium rileyi RCEF 4871]TWU78946.1 hypothetical protein ED733_008047 [Metarhizium rileyi]
MYSSFSFRTSRGTGTNGRTGYIQRALPLLGHASTIKFNHWPYSEIPLKHPFRDGRQKSEHERIQDSLGFALEMTFFRKILEFNLTPSDSFSLAPPAGLIMVNGSQSSMRSLPVAPFKVLDAPNLRDDFYCSVLAYSPSCQTLAIGLGNIVYTWSEKDGVRSVNGSSQDGTWLTSISFSSAEGNKGLFAAGRSDGSFVVMSLRERTPRFEIQQSHSIACLSWRPCSVLRLSTNPLNPTALVATEDLVVGDECGDLYYYLIEWPMILENISEHWPGSLSLVARISIHSQQICGLAWSPTGDLFASGANDNLCSLFDVNEILGPQYLGLRPDNHGAYNTETSGTVEHSPSQVQIGSAESQTYRGMTNEQGPSTPVALQSPRMVRTPQTLVRNLSSGCQSQIWAHQAAVKAIAFCPWLQGLVATGGGSNDKRIHFFHTISGSSLATISVAAQVTSLIWSNTKREIAATFGYAHPDHPYRIAVFNWPDCSQIAAIPWEDDLRALHAVPYPCMLKDPKGSACNPGAVNECIVVASSDKTVKFHEVWSTEGSRAVTRSRMFGGSDILEDLQGIIKEGDVIR